MLKPLRPMVQVFYKVNVSIIIDEKIDSYLKVKKYFKNHSDGEYLYSPSVKDALNRISN